MEMVHEPHDVLDHRLVVGRLIGRLARLPMAAQGGGDDVMLRGQHLEVPGRSQFVSALE